MKFNLKSAVILCLTTSACSGPGYIYDQSQSHFDFPNGNVVPLGQVSAEATETTFFSPSFGSAGLEDKAIQKALEQKGGDLLIDGTYHLTTTYLGPLPVYINKLHVEGQAAKLEIGNQILN